MIQSNTQRDQAIYNQVLRDHRGEGTATIDSAHAGDYPTDAQTARMRDLAKLPRRPPMTPHIAQCLAKLAEQVRPRAKVRGRGLYALPPSVAADVRRAIDWIDDNAEHFRRHK